MPGTNEFLPTAIGDGSYVSTTATWQASPRRLTGFQSGIVPGPDFNKAFRQPSVVSSMIGAFIAAQNLDALDNGDIPGLTANFTAALKTATAPAAAAVGAPKNLVAFTVAGNYTFTVPQNVIWLFVELVGAGGGGGGGSGGVAWSSGGGGSGGYASRWISVSPGQTFPLIVGAKGVGASNGDGAIAGSGGPSSFSNILQATGGTGGRGGTASCAGGSAGLGSGGQKNFFGSVGGDGNNVVGNSSIQGGQGAASAFGGGGRTSTVSTADINGQAPGSGGGGIWANTSGTGLTGGNGADGAIFISY